MNPTADLEIWAALASLDLLEEHERSAFARLLAHDPAAWPCFTGFQETAAALALAVPPHAPPPALHERLFERIARGHKHAQAHVTLAPGLTLAFGDTIPWTETRVPGVRAKPLYVDPARRYASSLVTMAAGTVYPAHQHRDVEELFMLSGDLIVAGHVIRAGDYCRAEAATFHETIRTEHGCTFIVLASLDDELLSAPVSGG
jgi:quercetin dioxygenase-like cupin family protein